MMSSATMDAIGIITAAIVPIIVMRVTLCNEKKIHKEQIEQIEEKNRVDSMPIIDAEATINIIEEDNKEVVINAFLNLFNKGNGTAIGITGGNEADYYDSVVPIGGSTSSWDVKMINNEKNECEYVIHFEDLYGNKYEEIITFELIETGSGCQLKRRSVTLPRLISQNY